VLLSLVAAGMLLVSWLLSSSSDSEWIAGLLVNVGSAILLFVPLYVLSKRLDAHISDVRREAVRGVEALTDRVSGIEEQVDRRLEEVATAFAERVQRERDADAAAFNAVAETPSKATLQAAVQRAIPLGLLCDEGPRVRVGDRSETYVRLHPILDYMRPTKPPLISLWLESIEGKVHSQHPWSGDEPLEDLLVPMNTILRRMTQEELAVEPIFSGILDALLVARTATERRPIVELCPPQWAVTPRGLVTYGSAPLYVASHDRLHTEPHFAEHIREKFWVDAESFDSAYGVSLSRFATK
jgi:hypothetical protein